MERPRTPSPCPVQDEPSSCPCENTSPDKDVKTNTVRNTQYSIDILFFASE